MEVGGRKLKKNHKKNHCLFYTHMIFIESNVEIMLLGFKTSTLLEAFEANCTILDRKSIYAG